jgi:hypothetical protein
MGENVVLASGKDAWGEQALTATTHLPASIWAMIPMFLYISRFSSRLESAKRCRQDAVASRLRDNSSPEPAARGAAQVMTLFLALSLSEAAKTLLAACEQE